MEDVAFLGWEKKLAPPISFHNFFLQFHLLHFAVTANCSAHVIENDENLPSNRRSAAPGLPFVKSDYCILMSVMMVAH